MSEEECEPMTLDLSKSQLKKVPKQEGAHNVRVLILDENELHKLDNIDSYLKVEKLSLSKNHLLRMYGVCRLHNLRELNLSHNGTLSIDGLKELLQLRRLNLEGNCLKNIEHLQTNTQLEYLNLADNNISNISDMSHLKCLKELYLHGNRLTHLRQCDKYLPISLETLTLARNNIGDLNEICTLSHLCNLQSITFSENPCVLMTNGVDGFDYRPFLLNWCMTLKEIDGFVVDPIESLKAEWLYSQGRGRQFRVGEQMALGKYLSSVCPLTGKALENENERKLRLILSKAQQHQRQLQQEISENSNNSLNSSPSGRKKTASRIQSPRFSRLGARQGSPESMISSYHGNTSSEQMCNHAMPMTTSLIENIKIDALMSQSFDTSISSSCMNSSMHTRTNNSQESTPRNMTPNPYNEQNYINATPTGGPLTAASKMVPVPETLMSPDVCPATVAQRVTVSAINSQLQNTKISKNKDNKHNSPNKTRSPHLKRNSCTTSPRKSNELHQQQQQQQQQQQMHKFLNDSPAKTSLLASSKQAPTGLSSDEDSDDLNMEKLKTIRNKAAQRCQEQKDNVSVEGKPEVIDSESSAVMIQKMWRGYRTRKKTKDIAEKLIKKRTNEYIEKLSQDMEMTKAQLENERKIQQLQMQAINALWKKISNMQTAPVVAAVSEDIGATDGDAATASKTINLDNSSAEMVHDLNKTCTMLTSQVQQLQGSMRDMVNLVSIFCNLPRENVRKLLSESINDAVPQSHSAAAATETTAAVTTTLSAQQDNSSCDTAGTQTEIIAVHTPQIENPTQFPFNKVRPSTLPLDMQQQQVATAMERIQEQKELNTETVTDSLSAEATDTSLTEKTDNEKEIIDNKPPTSE